MGDIYAMAAEIELRTGRVEEEKHCIVHKKSTHQHKGSLVEFARTLDNGQKNHGGNHQIVGEKSIINDGSVTFVISSSETETVVGTVLTDCSIKLLLRVSILFLKGRIFVLSFCSLLAAGIKVCRMEEMELVSIAMLWGRLTQSIRRNI